MKWVYSTNEENFTSDEFDTKEEAIEEGAYEAWDCEYESFYVGQKKSVVLTDFLPDTQSLVETLSENAYDAVGDLTDAWPSISREQRDELIALIDEWAIRNNLNPTFFQVINVESVEVPDEVKEDCEEESL